MPLIRLRRDVPALTSCVVRHCSLLVVRRQGWQNGAARFPSIADPVNGRNRFGQASLDPVSGAGSSHAYRSCGRCTMRRSSYTPVAQSHRVTWLCPGALAQAVSASGIPPASGATSLPMDKARACRHHRSAGPAARVPDGTAAQHRAHPRHHFARAERLADVIVGAAVQTVETVLFLRARRHHDDREYRCWRAAARHSAQAIHARQHPVQQDQVDVAGRHCRPAPDSCRRARALAR